MRQPGDDERDAPPEGGLGARLVALGGLELSDFGAAEAAGGEGVGEARDSGRTPRNWTFIVSAVLTVVLLACLGFAGHLFLRINDPSAGRRPPPPPAPAPSRTDPAAGGPWAVTKPVRTENDLDRVCAGRFYPSAPEYRGGGPHPLMISEGEESAPESRSTRTLNRAAFAGSAAQRRSWAPEPERAQMVACLDLTGSGRRIRDCRSGDVTRPLVEGRYRLTVYEVATHRKILEKTLTGTDRACPFVVLGGAGATLHSAVKDRQLYDLLRERVEP